MVLDYATKYASVTSLVPNAIHPLLGISVNRLEIVDTEPFRAEIESFFDAILEDKTPLVTAEDGRRALDLAIGVLEKIDEHAAKVFPK